MVSKLLARFEELMRTPLDVYPPATWKHAVRSLQQDIKTEVLHNIRRKEYEDASELINIAICLNFRILVALQYPCNTTLDKALLVLKAEIQNEMGLFHDALDNLKFVYSMDPNCELALVQEIIALYSLAIQNWVQNQSIESLLQFEYFLNGTSVKVKNYPKVQAIAEELENMLSSVPSFLRYQGLSPHQKRQTTNEKDEWLPDHVKAAKKQEEKEIKKALRKKKKKTKEIFPDKADNSDDSSVKSLNNSSSNSASDGTESASAAMKQINDRRESSLTDETSASSSYGLDNFGPINLPKSKPNNGAIPKLLQNGQKPQTDPSSTKSAPVSVRLHCKVCNVTLNGNKQLHAHLLGHKHIAKMAEMCLNNDKSTAATAAVPQVAPPVVPRVASRPAAQVQKPQFTIRTQNQFSSLTPHANLTPSPNIKHGTQTPLAATVPKPPPANNTAARQQCPPTNPERQASRTFPATPAKGGPNISVGSLNWIKQLSLRLACESCYVTLPNVYGYHKHIYHENSKHPCLGKFLLAKLRNIPNAPEMWGKIRPRTNLEYSGPYSLCEQFDGSISCKIHEDRCWYCHSQEELDVWKAERSYVFNRKEIMLYLRYFLQMGKIPAQPNNPEKHYKVIHQHPVSIAGKNTALPNAKQQQQQQQPGVITALDRRAHHELMSRVKGHFLFVCGPCFFGAPPILSKNSGQFCDNNVLRHRWEENKILLHVLQIPEARSYRFKPIRKRPQGIPARPRLCHQFNQMYGCPKGNTCQFAHNEIALEVWEIEHMFSLSRETLVKICAEPVGRPQPQRQPVRPAPTPNQTAGAPRQEPTPSPPKLVSLPKFSCTLKYVCSVCFSRGNTHVGQHATKRDYCAGSNSHPWVHKKVAVHCSARQKWSFVKPRHPSLRAWVKPRLCLHKENCFRASCMFPHFPEESQLWTYMAEYQLTSLEEVMDIYLQDSAPPTGPDAKQSSSNTTEPPNRPAPQPFVLKRYPCTYCDLQFAQLWELEQHTQTIEHRSRINSDKERQWDYRSPPWNVVDGQYMECITHKQKKCMFSHLSQENNNCTMAHSLEELEEWKERHQYRMMKLKKAKDSKLYAFMDEILTEYNTSTAEMKVITENMKDIKVECAEELNTFLQIERREDTLFDFVWKFSVKSEEGKKALKRVGLLYDEHRPHFYLSKPSGEDKPQVCPGNHLIDDRHETYHIDVHFLSRMLGSFSQWVIFDFGSRPVLVRKLEVHVGSKEHLHTFKNIKREKSIPTWDSSNSEIIRIKDNNSDEGFPMIEKLLATYKPPASLNIDNIEVEQLDRDSYKKHMHKMLYLEEREQTNRIARFSFESILKASSKIESPDSGTRYCPDGPIYATVNLKEALMDDSETSQIMEQHLHKMLLKFDDSNKVYEAKILEVSGSQTGDKVNLQLSTKCISEQALADEDERTVQVQFQINRINFCHLHHAVDRLTNLDMVFPPSNRPQRFPYFSRGNLEETNLRQERAAQFLCSHGGPRALPMPGVGPILIYGPFGTGKTATLSCAVKRIVQKRPSSRILICTHSNSAADWYITEYLHKFVEATWKQLGIRMLRIYTTFCNVNRIDPLIIPYTVMDRQTFTIMIPDAEFIKENHIVITTLSMVKVLMKAKLEGHFTHILIDEAGRSLEAETLQPLTLATSDTCVALAGDHLQMSPKVFSETARNAQFHISLLERLFDKNIANMFLTYNYRMCEPIVKFISSTYYEQNLHSHGNHPHHPQWYPLMFCAVKGEDQHVGMSYINSHEVQEIAYRVEELCRNWPENWGPLNKNSIGVIAPYNMQVRYIRDELRRRGLGDISVETVQNVQGKQYRALLISTVRTRSTLLRSHLTAAARVGVSFQQDQEFYLGFLSDHKLLNTALTRAQSLVIVVGDPVSLCSEGLCSTTWKAYLEECQTNKSLFPKETTLDSIFHEVEASKHRLNPFAASFQPHKEKEKAPAISEPGKPKSFWGSDTPGVIRMPNGSSPWKTPQLQSAAPNSASHPEHCAIPAGQTVQRQISEDFPSLRPSQVTQVDLMNDPQSQSDEEDDTWSFDGEDIKDAILHELYRQIQEDNEELKHTSVSSGSDSSTNSTEEQRLELKPSPPNVQPEMANSADVTQRPKVPKASRKPSKFRMVETGSRLLLVDKRDRSNIVGADDFADYDAEEEVDEDVIDESKREGYLDQVQYDPDKFKICMFHLELRGYSYATQIDKQGSQKILITSKTKQGKALNLDEVVVEILEEHDQLVSAQEDAGERKVYGIVRFILKRAVNLYLKKIVCTLDQYTDNLMVPINKNFPKIYTVSRKLNGSKSQTKDKTYQSSDVSMVSIFNINKASREGFQFQKNIEVSHRDRKSKVFIVQYLKWAAKTPYPLGIVTEELPPGDTKENGLRILKLIHGIREKWNPTITDSVKAEFPDTWKIPKEEIALRYDARNEIVFTIDPPDSNDLDDALSIDAVDDNYQVGIHIADVSYFVRRGSPLDEEARARGTSFYPSSAKTVNMLPPHLSSKMCSLLPGEDRLTVSVVFILDAMGEVVSDVRIVPSVINSNYQLTYMDAEKFIRRTFDGEDGGNSAIEEKVLMLSTLAKKRRKHRLQDGSFCFSHDPEEEEAQCPLAHSMVEEMMLLANEAVARYLLMEYPDSTPLRRQLGPSDDSMNEWLGKHSKHLPNSLELKSKLFRLHNGKDVTESDVCILEDKWKKLCDLVNDEEQNDLTKVADVVCTDENHPNLAVARSNFFRIQEHSDYIASGEHTADSIGHHSLRMPSYTHFTSPIRRYVDLVVHRLLKDALPNCEEPTPYTTAELSQICHHCTNQAVNAKTFENKTRELQFALKLEKAALPILSFVENVSDTNLQLLLPNLRFIPAKMKSVALKLLKPIKKPDIDEENNLMELLWKHRIYNMGRHQSNPHKPRKDQVVTLDAKRFVVEVTQLLWQEILTGIRTEDIDQIQHAVGVSDDNIVRHRKNREASKKSRQNPRQDSLPAEEVICGNADGTGSSPLFVNFKRSYTLGDVVQIQLHAEIHMGMLTPMVQLFSLTPKLSFCTEHRRKPIESFSAVALHRPSNIKNIARYKKVWLPIIEMISAHNAVQADETIIIHGVQIFWDREFDQETNKYNYTGFFAVSMEFCTEHQIRFSSGDEKDKKSNVDIGAEEVHLDYLCIRYSDVNLTHKTQLCLRELHSQSHRSRTNTNVHPGRMTFVVHAASVESSMDNEKRLVLVHITANQHSCPFPDDLLVAKNPPLCTVELIPKLEPDRRLAGAVRKLDSDSVSPLIRDICLHSKPRANQEDECSRMLPNLASKIVSFRIPNSPFEVPNVSQRTALKQALRQPFTVIQGPPGTGKTITGAHLAYFFTKMNKKLPAMGKGRPQVLYCGPSNKSVDVISRYLCQFSDVKVIRVYSETIERKEHPIPGMPGTTRKGSGSQEAKMDPQLRDICLHHLIRQKTNTHAREILDYDRNFATPDYLPGWQKIKAYKKLISAAEEEELRKYEIILCTCNASGGKRITKTANIMQCIVDEAGMCNEPETLIPLVATNPCQVVLIGDHKQLRPIIQEQTASLLGMEISLLEKYESLALMLAIQYRMHESICAFPSQAFYKGQLETADTVKMRRPNPKMQAVWPGGPDHHVAFCHMTGKEETLTVKTAEGNEQSKANLQEVDQVVRIAITMVRQHDVKPQDVIILSQYRLQCAEIEKRLKEVGQQGVAVRTVITSQGSEWDYVIMSTVRSLPQLEIDEKPGRGWKKRYLGFITDENQMNVALTRARRGLIIVGNQYLLQTHDKWREFIAACRMEHAVIDAGNFMRHHHIQPHFAHV